MEWKRMMNAFLRSLKLTNFLSFGPDTPPLELNPLNVLIGPNASGKSNLIEAFELLRATPHDLAGPIRDGGGASEWLWKGGGRAQSATIETILGSTGVTPDLRYRLKFGQSNSRLTVLEEALEECGRREAPEEAPFSYYRYQDGQAVLSAKEIAKTGARSLSTKYSPLTLPPTSVNPEQSVFSQRRDPDLYPELTRIGQQFDRIRTYREWSFGRYAPSRHAQPADLPGDELLADGRNLGLVLNNLQNSDAWPSFEEYLRRFLPKYDRLTTSVVAGGVQINLREQGLGVPIPGARLSDGTLRFLLLLSILLPPEPPPLICLEEPELGMHPDALSILADLLFEASTRSQLVVTTHSDSLVTALSEHLEAVLVCERGPGGTRLERLEPDRLKPWLERYALGELWLKGQLGGTRW